MNGAYIFNEFFGSEYRNHFIFSIHVTKDIVSCNYCGGTGFSSRESLVNYHKGEYETLHEECKHCRGCGRKTRTLKTIGLSPNYGYGDRAVFTHTAHVPYSDDPISSPHINVLSENISFELPMDKNENF